MNDGAVNEKFLKTITEEDKLNSLAYSNESEIIVKYLIEKLISLALSKSATEKVEKRIPDFCFNELKSTLDLIANLNLITYDKDDVKVRNKLRERSKSSKNINIALFMSNFPQLKSQNENLNKSLIIRSYELGRDYDPNIIEDCSINTDVFGTIDKIEKNIPEEKLVMEILVRKKYRDNNEKDEIDIEDKNNEKNQEEKKDPFQIPNEQIEGIKKSESHVDYISIGNHHMNSRPKLFFNSVIDTDNNWDIIEMPPFVPIDRDASTSIKFEKDFSAPKIIVNNQIDEINKEVNTETNNTENKGNKNVSTKSKYVSKFSPFKKDKGENKSKKKKILMAELSYYDIDPSKFEQKEETEVIKNLRIELEKELEAKRIEEQKEARKLKKKLEEEQKRLELQKELKSKNITVDINGNIVFIKPIKIELLMNEYKKGKAKSKDIKIIEGDTLLQDKNPIKVEKNFSERSLPDKTEHEKAKRRKSIFGPGKGQSKYKASGEEQKASSNMNKTADSFHDRQKNMKFAAGSNFDLINLECGVKLKEEEKIKSGGRDFFQKYGRCSVETFQKQVNQTATGFYHTQLIAKNPTSRTVSSNAREIILEEVEKKISDLEKPNESRNRLSLKTKNLRRALNNLDLITEGEERELNKKKQNNKNIIKESKKPVLKEIKSDLGEINIFTKTLMGDSSWGTVSLKEKTMISKSKQPVKPLERDILREVSSNLINHLPRKRLPPISKPFIIQEKMGRTSTEGFFSKRNKIKGKEPLKIENEIKDTPRKEKDMGFTTTRTTFYK